ncbi:MAG: POTRA domain-containing protein, partial [Vicinamibacterales bacterium]
MLPRQALLILFCVVALGAACKEDGTIAVHSISFTGVTHVDVALLKSSLATRENTQVPIFGWQLPWARKNAFDRGRFDADLQRITAFYADRGYPNARVTNVEVKPNENQSAVDVSLAIDEGEPVRIAAVEFRGFESLPAKQLELLKERVALSVGAPRDRQLVTVAHEAAVNELRDQGYPYARVGTAEDDGPSGRAATIVFTAEPGPIAHFGDIQISGNTSVSRTVIDRQLTFKPGDLYRRSLVQQSQRQLYALELFQFVNVEALEPELKSAVVKMRITVTEGKHHRVNFGVGYGTEEKGRVDAEYRQLNFLGGARSAGAHARWSSLDRGLRLDFVQPYFVAPHLSLGGEAQQWYTYTPAYRSIVTGAKATLTHRQTQKFSWSLSVGSERSSSSIEAPFLNDPLLYADLIALGLDPTTLTQAGTLSSLGFDVQRNTTDNPLNAHRGIQLAVHAEEAGRLLPGTFNYYAL